MATKHLHVTFSDGSVWAVRCEVIARARATYFAERDPHTTYQGEFDYALGDDSELMDWACNNMDWIDVVSAAEPLPSVQIDRQREWTNADKEIVTS